MSGSTPPDKRADALRLQIAQIERARRRVERAVDASGIVLGRGVGAPLPVRRRFRLLFSVSAGLALGAVILLHRTPVPLRPSHVAPAAIPTHPASSNRTDASVGPPAAGHTLAVHIHATRACRLRLIVDGTPLEWRTLRAGDEILSRPRQSLLLEADDGGALSATVNGARITLAPDGQAIAVRLTTERPYPEPVSLP